MTATVWNWLLLDKLPVTQSQNVPSFMEPEVSYWVHNILPLVPTMGQINVVHTLASCFFKIHFNVIFSSILDLAWGFFPSGFLTKILYKFFLHIYTYTYKAEPLNVYPPHRICICCLYYIISYNLSRYWKWPSTPRHVLTLAVRIHYNKKYIQESVNTKFFGLKINDHWNWKNHVEYVMCVCWRSRHS